MVSYGKTRTEISNKTWHRMNKVRDAFEKKYLISTFTTTGHHAAFGYFKDGYEARKAETCEWTLKADKQDYSTSCGYGFFLIKSLLYKGDFIYCPFCGGKIVEKENKG